MISLKEKKKRKKKRTGVLGICTLSGPGLPTLPAMARCCLPCNYIHLSLQTLDDDAMDENSGGNILKLCQNSLFCEILSTTIHDQNCQRLFIL